MCSLEILVKSATNVVNIEKFGKSDPYVQIEYQGQKVRTKHIEDNLNPEWNEALSIDLQGKPLSATDKLMLYLKDYEKVLPDRKLGQVEIPLRSLLSGNHELTLKLNILDKSGQSTGTTVDVTLKYIPPASTGATDSASGSNVIQQPGTTAEGEQVASGEVTAVEGGAITSGKGTTGLKRKEKPNYSDKPTDFQVRVKVVEARQLPVMNAPPVCKVNCASQSKETHVKSQTSKPYWNETFFFNFHEAPVTLMAKTITFGVYHSRVLRKDALIGSFSFEIGLAYEQDKHGLLNKWLLLSDPQDPLSGPKGYLKVSVVVLGPGDEAPSMKVSPDDDDIEANLLRPAGVQLRPAVFKFRLYRADDLPRMDPDTFKGIKNLLGKEDSKEFVDPFMVLSFAGAQVKSSTKYGIDSPEWNEELCINLQFPSMCEKLNFTFYDWDRVGNNDAIATGTIRLSDVSAYRDDDDGFLPTFGPCFVNLYGSPREFSDLPNKYEDLNKGKGDGAAYRGRALVELRTELLDEPTIDSCQPIDRDDVARVQKVLRRNKYRLNTAFLSAGLIPGEKDSPVEFEVSIGNDGNKLDDSVPPSASTTPPTNPVYDGVAFSHLPWGESKPCTIVDSQWEDISFRLYAVNQLKLIANHLTQNLYELKFLQLINAPIEQQATAALEMLDQFIRETALSLPEWTPDSAPENELDKNIRQLRIDQLARLRTDAENAKEELDTIDQTIDKLLEFRNSINDLAIEPQNSMPDVVIWMLVGGKRRAYYRIPAHEVLYSDNPLYRGMYCGIPQCMNFKKLRLLSDDEKDHYKVPVQVRAIFWLGLLKDQHAWRDMHDEASFQILAETYENQASIVGKWVTSKPPLTRPAWSDESGRNELTKESIEPPPGMKWEGDWFVDPEVSVLFKKDSGQTSFIEDVFYQETRTATTSWEPAEVKYVDGQGEPRDSLEEIVLPEGWTWVEDWEIDRNRLCDDEGFEYAITSSDAAYSATEKNFHMFRRRRLIRKRVLGDAGEPIKQAIVGQIMEQKRQERLSLMEKLATKSTENWEYAFNFDSKFHLEERKVDMVRRRRWHRRMVPSGPAMEANTYVMQLDSKKRDEEKSSKLVKEKANLTVPRMYLKYPSSHTWQLRAYIFQARDLLAADQSGLSDPYLICAFQGLSLRTQTLQGTITPTWDETLLFTELNICGSPQQILRYPPPISIEIYDWDKVGSNNYLGRVTAQPYIRLHGDTNDPPQLMWQNIRKGKLDGGELLASFELIQLDGQDPPPPPPRRGDLLAVPNLIRPALRRTGVEILCWGVRNMAKYHLASVNSPSVEFEIGGKKIESSIIKSLDANPNFSEPRLFLDVMLPVYDLYMPPLNITVRDHRVFGQKPRVGLHSLKDFKLFMVDPLTEGFQPKEDVTGIIGDQLSELIFGGSAQSEAPTKGDVKKKFLDLRQLDEDVDWWSKLYASLGEWDKCLRYKELGYDTLQVFNGPLEKQLKYNGFTDFCDTFTLCRGKNVDEDEDNYAGEFKGTFRIYPLPEDPSQPLPLRYFDKLTAQPEPEECIIRVYVIRALELQPCDPSGLADPYVEISIGKKKESSKDQYRPNTLNPEFGMMFQLKCTLPVEKDLIIRIKDYDVIGKDDIIGETRIDLENRRLTKFRATCGLPKTYYVSGLNQWRDSMLPSDILASVCDFYNMPAPQYSEADDKQTSMSCRVGPKNYVLADFEKHMVPSPHHGPDKERLALHILNRIPLVKEHVETRPLFSPLQPNIEQGRLQMWVDIFPTKFGDPGPTVNIVPRVPLEYVLRIVVWNTVEVILEEKSLLGEKMSDIYVQGWIAGVDERQKTDVHYRSLDGEGNFNWRFVFPFNYLPAENMIVVKRKEHFWSLDATETRVRPSLIMQVWDNDLFNPDDFLGTLELDLANMPEPAKNAKKCTIDMVQSTASDKKMINLFDCRRTKGFLPFISETEGKTALTGKIEMEMEICTKAEADVRPAAKARDEPNANPKLDPPKRPETSFLWITSPWKTFKFIIWRRCKWVFIGILLAIIFGLLLVLFIYAVPQLLARKMVGV